MKNIIFWLVAGYAATYALAYLTLGYEPTAYIIAALLFGLSFTVFVTWFTTGVKAIREGGREGEAVLAFSICVAAFYGVTTRLSSVYKITMDYPEWMNTSGLVLGQAVLLLIFFTGVLLAPETKGGTVPAKNFVWWAIAAALAGCFVGVIIGISLSKDIPDMPKAEGMAAPMSTLPGLYCSPPKSVPVRAYCRRPATVTADAG